MTPIHILMELSISKSEKMAIQLGFAITSEKEEHRKQILLEEYRQGYIEESQQKLAQGLNVGVFDNFNKFISSLDQLILNQKNIVDNCSGLIERCRLDWQESERKRLTYTALLNRTEHAIKHKAHKLDQKQTDEFASRRRVNKY